MPPTSPSSISPFHLRRATDGGVGAFSARLGVLLRENDRDAAGALVDEALGAGLSTATVRAKLLGAAMARIGELWELGIITPAVEAAATATCRDLLVRLRVRAPVEPGSVWQGARVLLAAAPGERHTLGLTIIADTLRESRFQVLDLGADISVSRLRAAALEFRPAIVGLSTSTSLSAAMLPRALQAVAEAAPRARVMLGGRGVPPALWSEDLPRVCSATAVVDVVEDLLRTPPQPLPNVVGELITAAA